MILCASVIEKMTAQVDKSTLVLLALLGLCTFFLFKRAKPAKGSRISPRISPFLWFDGQAEEAANFYASVFPNSRIKNVSRYSEAGKEFHKREPGTAMTVHFELDNQPFTALNGGPQFKFTEAISLMINCKDQTEVDYYWEKLTSDGGKPSDCGWLKDKFGLSWQVVPEGLGALLSAGGSGSKRAMNAMMTMKKLDYPAMKRAFDGDQKEK